MGLADGRITGDSTLFAQITNDVNLALDSALRIIFEVGGRWQFDDSNHTDYPIIVTNIVDGQRDYSFTTDGSSNLILDIYRVAILPSATSTLYEDITPVDVQSDSDPGGLVENNTTEGRPERYDKTANGIFLDPIPSYNATNGLKVWINREGSYFTTADTNKKPGIAGIFHEYLAIRPSYYFAMRNSLPNTALLREEMLRMERAITEYYANRERDVRHILRGKKINYI